MTRKPVFWIVFTALFIISGIYTWYNFANAFPLVSVDISMDRLSAIENAEKLAIENKWGPERHQNTASFGVDSQTRNFVELEGGGSEVFKNMVAGDLYSPYTWRVRLFEENETNEVNLYFMPQGKFYGFREKLSEDLKGEALTPDSAMIIAVTNATDKWQIDLSQYTLAEKSQEVRPSGRVDHTFTYERPDTDLGEGRYRLRLVVSGDKLTELKHFVKVPEAFERRYDEMRSANNTIATVSLFAIGIIYVLGGIVFGLFYLLKQRWVLWRKPLYWGIFVGLLQVLVEINRWPLIWMHYDTALSAQGFFFQQVLQLLLTFIGLTILLSASFMAAESLTRKAFPNHIQFWKLWSGKTAASPEVLGRTISGYLFVTIFFAFEIALYIFATNVLGWWSPLDSLFDPDVLASYFPWLSSIAISLQAGFMEECLFRAIPIAGAALLGQRFGYRKTWIVAAFILQAVIFGAGHANYPTQPAYARVVELIIPSIGFGLIYLYLGLLPAIVMHFAFDVIMFALPLFVSSAPGVWLDKLMVILLTFIPLWIVLFARLRKKRWQELDEQEYNRSWKPPEVTIEEKVEKEPPKQLSLSGGMQRALIIAGIAGLALWFVFSNFKNYAPAMDISRTEAEQIARERLESYNIKLDAPWQTLSSVIDPMDQDDRFVWKEGGEDKYSELLGVYLAEPRWEVRFVRFTGSTDERTEEFRVYIDSERKVIRAKHTLPESMPSATLEEDSARTLVYSFIRDNYGLDPLKLKEVSAKPAKLPQRRDWTFTYKDSVNYNMEQGEARITIKIAGDHVVDGYRYVHVPQEWARNERNGLNTMQTLRALNGIVTFLLFLAGIIIAIVMWSRKKFAVAGFLIFFLVVFMARFINLLNSSPALKYGFSTAEPLMNQQIMIFGLPIIGYLFAAAAIGLIVGFTIEWNRQTTGVGNVITVGSGYFSGALLAGALAVLFSFAPSFKPLLASYSSITKALPVLGGITPLVSYITLTAVNLLVFMALDRFTQGWAVKKGLFIILFLVLGLTMNKVTSPDILYWIISGLVIGVLYLLFYIFVFRYNMSLVPLVFATPVILTALKGAVLNATSSAVPVAILTIALIGLVSYFWHRQLQI